MVLVDWDGRFPWLIAIGAFVVGVVTGIAVAMGEEEHHDRNSNQEETYFAQYDEKELIRMVEMEEEDGTSRWVQCGDWTEK